MGVAEFVTLLLLSLVQLSLATCPRGCDCVTDPALSSAQLVICSWTADVHDDVINVENVRSIQITCLQSNKAKGFSIPPTIFAQANSIQQLTIEGCDITDPSDLLQKLTNLRSLHLEQVSQNGHSLLSLKDESFSALSRLEKLEIVDCRLQRLPSDTFCHLKNVQVLNVSGNALSSLKQEAGCSASQLIIADFSRNHLDKLNDYLHIFPTLRQLSLAHNRIVTLPSSSLVTINHLQQLDLEDNHLDSLESMPETLVHLNLAQNRLRSIPEAVQALPLLVSLNLSRNSLSDSATDTALDTNVLESLDLSYNQLKNLPASMVTNSLPNLVHLHLDHNLIEVMPVQLLQNSSSLLTLNLANNRLRVLKEDTFSGLQKLASLRLDGNVLDTIEQGVFTDLSIDELNLSGNRFTEAPHALARLYRLKKLDLSHNKISKLYQFVFNKIPHLHTVNISYNELQSFGPYVFSDSEHLTQLDLSNNQIYMILRDSLSKCSQLRRLDLSQNRLTNLEDVLSFVPSIRRLDVSNNRLTNIVWASLPAKLEYLIAAGNNLSQLDSATTTGNVKLRIVNFADNQLATISANQLPHSLEELDVSRNRLQDLAAGSFSQLAQLRRVNLSNNKLKIVSKEAIQILDGVQQLEIDLQTNPLVCNCQMDWILMPNAGSSEKRRLAIRNSETISCQHVYEKKQIPLYKLTQEDLLCDYQEICEPGCLCCEYGYCDCKPVCPTGCNCYRDATFKRNIVRCDGLNETAMKLFTPSDVPMSATEVYLTGLNLPVLREHTFVGRERLEQLHINGSRIQKIEPKAFNSLPSLKLVDLSDNHINEVKGDEFHKANNISHLFLNGNRISAVDQTLLDKLPNLQSLTLHKNEMTELSPALTNARILSVSLGTNPFRCDCSERFAAAHWIHANRARVIDIDRVLCVENVTKAFRENDTTVLSAYPPNEGHDIFRMPMIEFFRDFNRTICVPISHGFFGQEPQNSILIFLFMGACGFLLCFLILLAIGTIQKTHSAINQRRYKASSSLNCSSTPGSSPLPLPLLNYDAFVSYSKKDEKLVQDSVCRRLEDADYSLCLLHRDGPIYNHRVHTICDELIAQMESSQSLILVLTRNFLENEWKTLQIKTSHQLFGKNRSKRLIAVFVDDSVDQNLLDDELGQMLRKNTCLRLSDPLFWTLLRSALPNRISPPPSDSSQIYSDMYGVVPSAMV